MKQIVYIVTAKNQSIEVWELLHNGIMSLKQIINTNFQEGQPLVILKKKKKIYIGVRPNYKILVYDILIDGTLKQIGSSVIPYSPNYLSCDDEEKFLFCGYYHAGCMSMSKINKFHIPNQLIQIINNIKGCHSVNINDCNKCIYVPSLLSNRIYVYYMHNIKQKNIILKLLEYVSCQNNSGPRHIAIHSNKKYLYSVNELNGSIDVWKIDKKNMSIIHMQNISLFQKKNVHKKAWSADIHITSCGKYLYASDRLHNTITGFQINNNKLDFIDQFQTCAEPKSFCIDKNNKYLICSGQKSNTIIVYNIVKNHGSLNKLFEYKVGKQPTWIAINTL